MSRITERLGITAPILQGPFGGMSSVRLAAAVSEAGGLGGFGLYGYDGDRITRTLADLRAATGQPVNVNLWLPTGDEAMPDEVDWDTALAPLLPYLDEVGAAVPARPSRFLPPFAEQVEAVLAARPAVLSVVFGVPDADLLAACRDAGIRVIGTATTVAEAVALDEVGVDAIVASGAEAGGHRVSFLAPPEDSLVGTIALVPAVVDAVAAPVIAAGGIADRRGVAAAFALGAEGVQVGTAFLRTAESAASPGHRAALDDVASTGTVLTRAMSGRLARGVRNRVVAEIEAGGRIAPFPAQNWLTGQFRPLAAEQGRADLLGLWAGQGAPVARGATAAEVFAELLAGVPV